MAEMRVVELNHKQSVFLIKRVSGPALFVFTAIFAVLSRTIADPDLWGHLRFGLDIMEAGRVIKTDSYSYLTSGQQWINHEWLSEVIFALLWKMWGSAGLILLKLVVGLATFFMLYQHLAKSNGSSYASVLLIIVFFLQYHSLATVRPQMFTSLLFTGILLILIKAQKGEYRWLWGVPFIFLFWVNLHGGFLAGIGILLLWTFFQLLGNRLAWKSYIPAVLAAFGAIFINPYGSKLLILLLRTATVPRPEIMEWQSLQIFSALGVAYLVLLILSIIGFIFHWRQLEKSRVILFGVVAAMPFVAIRHLQLFSIAAPILTGLYVSKVRQKGFLESPKFLAVCVICAGAFLWLFPPELQQIRIPGKLQYPVNAISILKKSGVQGNLGIAFEWGEYAIWHVGPRIKVSMDGRRETVYSEDTYRKYWNFVNGVEDWDALLTEYKTEMVLIRSTFITRNLLMSRKDWTLVYESNGSVLFVKSDSQLLDPIKNSVQFLSVSSAPSVFP